MSAPILSVEGLAKRFRLHLQGGVEIAVFRDLSFSVAPGEVVAVKGPSGMGKSSLLKLIYGTYRANAGAIRVRGQRGVVDVASAPPREIIDLRRETLGYVTQFLRVIPRVPALDVVAEPLIDRGVEPEAARARAMSLLRALDVPERLWSLSPATFSGGEQQRINIARGFAAHHPLMLLDEPTASLDAQNRERVLALIAQAREAGAAILCIFHDQSERERVASREIDLASAADHGFRE